ncbi:hypothetical protein EC957_001051 [Mortierella hygrophila]|uniref:Uncharacterized protein n=1 Tax=Mortierella hygrophila TaxID=979708 RepID=A0A9P6F668_9FUNG|nr:hypothetical protein EC957_001051 [Mortierella hygrophila]
MTTYPAVVQDHRQLQEVQPQAPRQDRRSELVNAAAVAYKALQGVLNDYEQQTGNSTAGISVATLLGKRSIGRPSKVRLENEETALLGIKRAKSEMKELEQVPKQLNGVVGQARIASAPRTTDIDKADTLGHTAHLSITSTPTEAPTFASLGDSTGAGVSTARSPAQKQVSDTKPPSTPVLADYGPSGEHISS